MLQIQCPPTTAHLALGTTVAAKSIPIQNTAEWVQLWIRRQQQAEDDMSQLYGTVKEKYQRNTQAFKQIEAHYDHLYAGTKFLYEAFENDRKTIDETFTKEMTAVIQYQESFAREVQQMINKYTTDTLAKVRTERTEARRIQNAVDFVQQIAEFQGNEITTLRNNISQWADKKYIDIATLQDQLAESVQEIKKHQAALAAQAYSKALC